MSLLDQARAIEDRITAWRRDFHMHPELSFKEYRTAQVVSDSLHEMGIQVRTGVGKTGVVGTLGSGKPVIGIRADMDALPIQEANDVPYRSQTDGVMHACGHDAHTAMLLGAAHLLVQLPHRPAGTIRLLFQPAEEDWDEEIKSGAMRMIEEGSLDDVDAVIALHIYSGGDSGTIQIQDGYDAAAVDTFEAAITGTGGHGAYPHKVIDPIYILAQVINAIHGIRARRLDPLRPAVISIGAVHAGEATNVIPDRVEVKGTIRTFDEATRERVWHELDAALGVARALGGDYTLKLIRGYPALYNDPAICEVIREVVRDLAGPEILIPAEPGMGSEDFSYMAQMAPGAMFVLGARLDNVKRLHHMPLFDIDEKALPMGSAVLAQTALRLLELKGISPETDEEARE
jgi:amidohydrolase